MIVPPLAVLTGTFIIVAVLLALLVAASYAAYTFRGSGIGAHPHDGSDEAPGAADPSESDGSGRTFEDNDDEFNAGGGFSTHGTQ